MWILPEYNGTLEELIEEVTKALKQFDNEKSSGIVVAVGDDFKL